MPSYSQANSRGLSRFNQRQMRSALSKKYQQSSQMFYSKMMDTFIRNKRSSLATRFKYALYCNEPQECLKKYYPLSKLPQKLKDATEYYQYNIEIPRIFIKSVFELCVSNFN